MNEPILNDDYPVYVGYLYVSDGKVISSDFSGTVRQLKSYLNAKEICRCDIGGRLEKLNATRASEEKTK